MDEQRREVRREDGRVLEVLVAGDPAAMPFVFQNGTPTAAALFAPMVAAAAERGLRTITYSRPGYAGSSEQPGRSVAAAAADVAAVLDALGDGRFVTVGWSGGGPHALACAALLGGRCAAAATIASIAPYAAEGLEWMAGMGDENIEEFSLTLQGAPALTPWLERYAADLASVSGDGVAAALGSLVTDVDRAALTGEFADFMAGVFHRAVSTGIAGWRDDDLAFARPWGFDLAAISVPVSVWQGGEDRMVPYAHGAWLAAHVAGARVHLHPEHGHLSLGVAAIGDILDDLVGMAAGTR